MRVWRICKRKYAAAAFAGEGAPLVAGRWNPKGVRMAYTCSWVALEVPSAAIAGEWNVLLNPAYPEFSKIKIDPPQPFVFDPRMFR